MSNSAIFQASINAAKWGYFGAAIKMVAQVLAQILIARQLGPDQFGVFAIATIVIGLANFFADLGMSLVQKREVTESDIRHVFTIQFIIGLTSAAMVFLTAGQLASLLEDTRSSPVIAALSLVLLFNATSAVSMNLLRRELDFRGIQIAQISSYVIGFLLIGVTLAFLGAGVWSLVIAWIAQSFLNLGLLYNKTRHSCRFLFGVQGQAESNKFNTTTLLANIANWAVANVPRIFISKIFPTQAIGIYSMTYNLLMAPLQHVLSTLQQVLFSSSSRLQHDKAQLAKTFLSLAGGIGFFSFPLFFGMSLMAQDITLVLFGNEWIDASDVFKPMAMAMPMLLLMGCATPIIWGMGKVSSEFWTQVATVVVLSGAVLLATRHSFVAVVWTITFVLIARSILMIWVACRLMNVTLPRFLRTMVPGLTATILVAMLVSLANMGMSTPEVHSLMRLSVNFAIILAVLFILVRSPRLFSNEVNSLLAKVSTELPSRIRPLLNRPGTAR
jgi:O-antigen/teichoic acid export membrane protein